MSPGAPQRADSAVAVEAHNALATVDDPEYPGISIVELGLVESIDVDRAGTATIGLIPTFSGCPALELIATDAKRAVEKVAGITRAEVSWLRSPVWTIERISDRARAVLADQFTVAVSIGGRSTPCPRCGGPLTETSMFGPSRCRSVHRCQTCDENVEVMRG